MAVFLVFNELSAVPPVASIAAAQVFLAEFSKLVTDQRIKGSRILVTPTRFLQLQVCAGYSVGRWLAEHRSGDHESRLRVKTLVDRRRDYSDYIPVEEFEARDVEYKYAGQTVRGLVVAFAIDGLALSFWSNNHWNVTSIEFEKFWIDGENIAHRTLNVIHACLVTHLDEHLEWLREHAAPPPANGVELWRIKDSLFPSLDFCRSVENQITSLPNDSRFRAVLRGLQDLQHCCNTWMTDNFDVHQLANASGESQSTLNMYSDERTFLCPDGEYRVFEWHLKRGDTRIHFFDFPLKKRILVGYIGPHLRISSQ